MGRDESESNSKIYIYITSSPLKIFTRSKLHEFLRKTALEFTCALTNSISSGNLPLLIEENKVLKESYISNWRNLPDDAVKIRVAHPSVLAPSETLLSAFMKAKKDWMAKGLTELEARKKAWKEIDYEERFRQEVLNNPKAMAKLNEIRRLAKEKDVYLICYEKGPPCHRFILMKMAGR